MISFESKPPLTAMLDLPETELNDFIKQIDRTVLCGKEEFKCPLFEAMFGCHFVSMEREVSPGEGNCSVAVQSLVMKIL